MTCLVTAKWSPPSAADHRTEVRPTLQGHSVHWNVWGLNPASGQELIQEPGIPSRVVALTSSCRSSAPPFYPFQGRERRTRAFPPELQAAPAVGR